MGELGALFNPGMRHEIEERESKQNRREEEGNARDGDLRIDLASGVAVINIPGRAADRSDDEPVAGAGKQGSRTVGAKPATPLPPKRSAHPRAEERRSASGRNGQAKDHASGGRSDKSESDAARPAPAPASKASRAGR